MKAPDGPARLRGPSPGRLLTIQETKIEPKTLRPTGLDHDLLDTDAVRAVQRLQSRDFEAYLVGGCVRDFLLGRSPKDYDIATAARPTQVKRTFPRNCRIIGRRFKLAHLHFNQNRKILEVATFRTSPAPDSGEGGDLLITRDNEFGTAEEDAVRRDFTVNALFLDPVGDEIIDFVGGLEDVERRVLRTIGDPVVRFREDPVRIIRAAKFAGRLGFSIEESTYAGMTEVAPDLSRAAPPRMLEEILRLLRGGHALESFQILRDIGALKVVLPVISEFLEQAEEEDRVRFWRMLEALDHKVQSGAEISNPVLLGALFAVPVRSVSLQERRRSSTTVAEQLIGPFAAELRLPRRDAGCLKRICGVQLRFTAHGPKRFKTSSFLRDTYFSEAIELFELTCAASGEGMADLERWQDLYREARAEDAPDEPERPAEDGEGESKPARSGRRRRGRSRKRGSSAEPREQEAPTEDASASSEEDGDEQKPARSGRRRRGRSRKRGSKATEQQPADQEATEAPEATADAGEEAAEGNDKPPRQRRRRRGRRGRGARRDGDDAEKPTENKKKKAKKSVAAKKRGGGKDETQSDGKPAKKRGSRGGKKKTARKPRARRDRQVETIEPETFDVSAFDVELDPKRVPTFGTIVEGGNDGGSKKKRRKQVPRVPPDGGAEDYKPPPPPGPGGDSAPPPPPPPSSDDEFGDW